jgi:hypothetical protein
MRITWIHWEMYYLYPINYNISRSIENILYLLYGPFNKHQGDPQEIFHLIGRLDRKNYSFLYSILFETVNG